MNRNKFGNFKSIFGLMTIEGFDKKFIENIKRFVRIYSVEDLKFCDS